MKAVIQSGFGSATDVLSVEDVRRPSNGPNEVLVRVAAVGIAKGNWLVTHGLPYIARASYGFRRPKQRVSGLQFAGTVVAVGNNVRGICGGDAVFGVQSGALAEFVAAPHEAIALRPVRVSFEEAAAAPVSGVAALQAVRDAGQVKQGQRVLIIGASGSVGSFALQIAKGLGAHVTGVASTRNLTLLRDLGADDVIDYTREEPLARKSRYDVIVDIAGNRRVGQLRRALAPHGTLVIVGGSGGRWTMGFGRTIGGMLLAPFVNHRIVGLLAQPNHDDLNELALLMGSGTVVPVVQPPIPLDNAAEAIEAAGAGHGAGTVVVGLL
jgi:NADPH:quinone reductase-like Zn-dependent oxidoreductase